MLRDGLWKRWKKAQGLARRYGDKPSPTLKGQSWASAATELELQYRAEEQRLLQPDAMLILP